MIYADSESILRHEDNKIQNANVSYTKKIPKSCCLQFSYGYKLVYVGN